MSSPSRPPVTGRPAAEHAQPADRQLAAAHPAKGRLVEVSEVPEVSQVPEVSEVSAPLWMRLVPPLVTLAVMVQGIREPSYWRDEAATLSAVQRPFAELLRMLGNVDVMHGGYYVVMWPVVWLAGSGELATRLPSALAMAAAAAATAGLGRRLVSPRAGLAAGLVFAILPQVSLYGQATRPYAMATALAAAASYLLVRAMQAAASGAGVRGWLTGYAACLTALGYLHPFALLLVVAHAVPVTRPWLRRAGTAKAASLPLGWLAGSLRPRTSSGSLSCSGPGATSTARCWP